MFLKYEFQPPRLTVRLVLQNIVISNNGYVSETLNHKAPYKYYAILHFGNLKIIMMLVWFLYDLRWH